MIVEPRGDYVAIPCVCEGPCFVIPLRFPSGAFFRKNKE